MANEYIPTVWETGDLITAEKLNKIEDGIAGAPVPTGTITITENGENIDVSEYALADVNVSGGGSSDFSVANITVALNLTGEYEGEKSVAVIQNVIIIKQDELRAGIAIKTSYHNTQIPFVIYNENPIFTTLEPGLNFELTNATITGEGNSAIYDDGGADLTIATDGVLTITAVYTG